MKKYSVLGIVLALFMVMSVVSFSENQDAYTIMIYLNGSDLESTYDTLTNSFAGSATTDLNEMIEGQATNGKVNVIVQTGGTKDWANDYVDPDLTQRFELINGEFVEMHSMPPQNIGYKKNTFRFYRMGCQKLYS